MTSYRELRVALPRPAKIAQLIEQGRSDHIHIATEGPIGLLVRRRSRICRSPRARAQSLGRGLGVDDVALVSRRNSRGDGGDPCARR